MHGFIDFDSVFYRTFRSFNQTHFGRDTERSDLAALNPAPVTDIILDVVKQRVSAGQSTLNIRTVIITVAGMYELDCLVKAEGFTVDFPEAIVV